MFENCKGCILSAVFDFYLFIHPSDKSRARQLIFSGKDVSVMSLSEGHVLKYGYWDRNQGCYKSPKTYFCMILSDFEQL